MLWAQRTRVKRARSANLAFRNAIAGAIKVWICGTSTKSMPHPLSRSVSSNSRPHRPTSHMPHVRSKRTASQAPPDPVQKRPETRLNPSTSKLKTENPPTPVPATGGGILAGQLIRFYRCKFLVSRDLRKELSAPCPRSLPPPQAEA